MAKQSAITQKIINWEDLIPTYTRENNPNKMSDSDFTALKAFMGATGSIQSILVIPAKGKPGKYQIFDGHHRYWASEEVGKIPLPAIVTNDSVVQATLKGLGLNKIRGEPDITAVAAEISRIVEQMPKLTPEMMSPLVGFSAEEIEAMTRPVQIDDETDVLDDMAIGGAEENDADANPKPYLLEIQFSNREDYKLARKKLKKAAGKGGDLARGLLTVLGEDDA